MIQPDLIDPFGRRVHYLRLSVTDRCDFRCRYCMAEDMTFLPRDQVLSLEELATVAKVFRRLGGDKLRITGGEPLIRRDVLRLFQSLGKLGFADLSLTTNGARLREFAQPLVDAGVHRVNISLDSLQPDRFRDITRTGDLAAVLAGIEAARNAGFRRIKINVVVMRHFNLDEVVPLTRFALERGLDISFIEEMPLGEIDDHERRDEFVSSEELRNCLVPHFSLSPVAESSGGPARYWAAHGYANRVGFISPHSHNFCSTCNRVRVSAEGRILLCLGNEHSADLRSVLRSNPAENVEERLAQAMIAALRLKPERHHFNLDEPPQILRFMNATGG
ncbi:MAG: GTP 3',8-cyclase MoaA [Cellvibrionaceae bacterium]|nr:GTP 3',8-cyclase MoaA [Cellvibrionaceae bacterium]